jgi:hypothetical protein
MLTLIGATAQTSTVIGWGLNANSQATPPVGLVNAVSVAAGFRYSLAVRDDGMVVGWGNSAADPPTVPVGLNSVAALMTRGGRNLAARSNGTVVAWSFFEPDLGERVPAELSNVIAVVETGGFSLALRADGTVISWGGSHTNVPPGLSNVISIAANNTVSLAARSDGRVVAWTQNGSVVSNYVPSGLSNVVAIAASHIDYSMALKGDGTVVTWGTGAGGVGPVPAGLSNVVAIDANSLHAMALKSDGRVVVWGPNDSGQSIVPARATNITAISVGFSHMLAVSRSTLAPWPWITEQPRSAQMLAGDTMTLSVTANAGAPLSYRWQYRGQNLPEQTNATLVLRNLRPSDAGDYAVVVRAGGLSVRSAPAFLSVTERPLAVPLTVNGLEDTDVVITLDGFNPLTMTGAKVVSLPMAGTLFQFDPNSGGRGARINEVPAVIPMVDSKPRVIFVPEPDGNGVAFDKFFYTVTNEWADSLPAEILVDIQSVNDPPSFTAGADQVVPEDSGPQVVKNWATEIRAGPPDETAQRLAFIVRSDNAALFLVPPAIDVDGTLTYTPAPDASGAATVVISLQDDGGRDNGGFDASESRRFVITITPVNDPPIANAQSISVNEDASVAVLLGAYDAEGDALTYSVGQPLHGTLNGTPPRLVYQPSANYFGPDSFTFSVNDGRLSSVPATVSIQVHSVNDPPVAVGQVSAATLYATNDSGDFVVVAPNNDNVAVVLDASPSTDVDNDPLNYLWLEQGGATPFAEGLLATNVFADGTYVILLRVSDHESADTDAITLEIISPGEAVEDLIALVEEAAFPRARKRPLVATLKAALVSLDHGKTSSGLNQLQAFEHKVRAQAAIVDSTSAPVLIDRVSRLVGILESERPKSSGRKPDQWVQKTQYDVKQ